MLRLIARPTSMSTWRGCGLHFDRAVGRRVRSAHPTAVSLSGGLIIRRSSALRVAWPSAVDADVGAFVGITYSLRDDSLADEMHYVEGHRAPLRNRERHRRGAPPGERAPGRGTVSGVSSRRSPRCGSSPRSTRASFRGRGREPTAEPALRTLGRRGDVQSCIPRRHGAATALRVHRRHLMEFPKWFEDSPVGRTITSGLVHDIVYAHTPDLLYRERGLWVPDVARRRPCSPTSSVLGPRRGSRLPAASPVDELPHPGGPRRHLRLDRHDSDRDPVEARTSTRCRGELPFPGPRSGRVHRFEHRRAHELARECPRQALPRLRPPTFPP